MNNIKCVRCGSLELFKNGKKGNRQKYKCKKCKKCFVDKLLVYRKDREIKSQNKFDFNQDVWDLRYLAHDYKEIDFFNLKFSHIKQHWLKILVKKYIKLRLDQGTSIRTVPGIVTVLNYLSDFIYSHNLDEDSWLNRDVILAFISQHSRQKSAKTIISYLTTLRRFFDYAQINNWLDVPPYLIRPEDAPKQKQYRANDIPKIVFDQINDCLHELPDDIARMWMVAYFCGMRISELILCPIDCIKQDAKGQWSITFWRKKTKDYHTLPISRELALIIQEQQKYTRKICGEKFEYLFFGLSGELLGKPKLSQNINQLIKDKDIKDENGKLWHFTAHQLRDTRATYLFETGHEMAIVSKWLGHKRWTTTQKYIHVKDNTLREETAKVQAQLTNIRGESVAWESLPKTLQDNPVAHTIAIPEDHINTPIYGFCGLALDKDCPHWKACYTCRSFVARKELLPDYIKIRDRLRDKQSVAEEQAQTALIDQFKQQADSLDVIVHSFGGN